MQCQPGGITATRRTASHDAEQRSRVANVTNRAVARTRTRRIPFVLIRGLPRENEGSPPASSIREAS
jgi:hypothetical protein